MSSVEETRKALERELEGYVRHGDTERAKEVREAIAKLDGRKPAKPRRVRKK